MAKLIDTTPSMSESTARCDKAPQEHVRLIGEESSNFGKHTDITG